ncbi:hypothetical protein NE237_003056 [Protea cynaroides]|uniref:Uncharacterized protein n=1 Tax=Protea cynaroides TaxID=273540 RepID=A0A9Q0QS82_9MAGN|nr:hypothetical protein NE237_003056 [Protea cynaroides]
MTRRITRATRISPSVEPALQSCLEHVVGRKNFITTAQISGLKHEIEIECNRKVLRVKVHGEVGLIVKRLVWKFKGNERIAIGGSEVEFYQDVFNWVAGSAHRSHHLRSPRVFRWQHCRSRRSRRLAHLEPSTSMTKVVYGVAVTNLTGDVKFGFKVSKTVTWVLMCGFMWVTTKKPVIFWWLPPLWPPCYSSLGKSGLFRYLNSYQQSLEVLKMEYVKVTGDQCQMA